MKLSVLDLSPVLSDSTPREALLDSVKLAQFVESLGYYRYWFAEHHNMEGIATSAPEIMIGHVAHETKTLRLGSGGIMLPNHSPLKVAETFRTLEALYPGRIDLGLGRAPGTDMNTAYALRRSKERVSSDHFTEELAELMDYLAKNDREGSHSILAMPTATEMPELWLLGSSDFSAKLAAKVGLGFSFADHFSGYPAEPILNLYRSQFRPSKFLAKPRTMIGAHVICAETNETANELALSSDYTFTQLRQRGISAPLPSIEECKTYGFFPKERDTFSEMGPKKFVGSPDRLKKLLLPYLNELKVDEVIVTTFIYDQKARRKSYELLMKLFKEEGVLK